MHAQVTLVPDGEWFPATDAAPGTYIAESGQILMRTSPAACSSIGKHPKTKKPITVNESKWIGLSGQACFAPEKVRRCKAEA